MFEDLLTGWGLDIHFLESDLDHNRTVSAFSGDPEVVFERLERLCEAAFERIDLTRHMGVHPRIGALDVCPFVGMNCEGYPLKLKVEAFGQRIGERFGIPIFLYEQSERGKHAFELPRLRRGGFGGLIGRELDPDFGPGLVHPRLGATVIGVREFLIAMNVNFASSDLEWVKGVAADLRKAREEGDPKFFGVRALGFPLASRKRVQLSLNLTQPNMTSPDLVIEWALEKARLSRVKFSETELIGVIREQDLEGATRLPVRREQVV